MTTETENGMARTAAEARREQRIDMARGAVEEAQVALARAQEQLDKAVNPYPKEPAAGAVIRFSLRFDRLGTTYHYAALRVMSRWFTTGKSCPKDGYSWYELIDFIREADEVRTDPYELLSHTARVIEL